MIAQLSTPMNTNNRTAKILRLSSCVAGLATLGIMLSACSGDTGNSEAPTANENTYSSDPGSTGTIDISLSTDTISVADSASYHVEVRKGDGSPLSNVRVACDTERGLALIEPTTGVEATDSYGNMSGRVGCDAPGSFQIGCRLPIGANKRIFKTIKCTGNTPEGFTGFEGAGGGGLFGGVATPPNGAPGGVGTEGVEVTSVFFEDANESPTDSIDIYRDPDCDNVAATLDLELFTDSFINLKVTNNSNQSVRLTGYQYRVASDGFLSRIIPLAGSTDGTLEIGAGGAETSARGLFLSADIDATLATVDKRYIGSGSPAPTQGFKAIQVEIFGENESGDSFSMEVDTAASFYDFNRCE